MMKTKFRFQNRILAGIGIILVILTTSESCTKTTAYDYPAGGNTGGKGGGTPGTNEVWIQNMAFTPSSVTIAPNTTITWTNKDGMSHSVTSDGGTFNSGILSTNQTYPFKFTTPGTFTYHCSIHPSMTARIIVSGGTPTASVSISGMAFSPPTITVAAGTIVTWTNNDTMMHTVTSDNGVFDSGSLNPPGVYTPGGKFSFTFAPPGTYNYHCMFHATMTGKIIVN
jgi:plastocyanin